MRESLLERLTTPEANPAHAAPLSLAVFEHSGDQILEGVLHDASGRWWWIAKGVPRLLPSTLYASAERERRFARELRRLDLQPTRTHQRPRSVERDTRDRFGREWRLFRDWGFHRAAEAASPELRGGLWPHTLDAFRSKTFLADRVGGALVLDAGADNGRFTAAALHEGAREVIAVDLGWGVEVCQERFASDRRVHVVQANLLELPIRCVDVAFSIGVLMHTRDPRAAFVRIAQAVAPQGLLAVRLYHRGNWAYEAIDHLMRCWTTKLSPPAQLRLARRLAEVGKAVERVSARRPSRGGLTLQQRLYRVFRHWPTVHHNLDWWSAPRASHHTLAQTLAWAAAAQLRPLRTNPPLETVDRRWGFFEWPESLTALFQKAPAAAERRSDATVLEPKTRRASETLTPSAAGPAACTPS